MKKIFNFSAGPSMLPKKVLLQAKRELQNWKKMQVSVMEISHRSKIFIEMTEKIEQDIRELLNIPEKYKVLFCHGGGRGQFSAVPLNILMKNDTADYIDSGYWSHSAMQESKKYCIPNIINVKDQSSDKFIKIIPMKDWNISNQTKYIHYCPNETISGIAIHEEPNFTNPVVADFSSTILSQPININKYDLIYASAQKNIGPSGITIVIINKDLLKKSRKELPSFLDYKIISDNHSMFNTPPTFSWYLSGLVFKWLKSIGGLKKIKKINKNKANILYNYIDKSDFYYNNVYKKNRSMMNVTFKLTHEKLNDYFIKESMKKGLYALKGHKIIGGMRASIYNAMPISGVKKLISFMNFFEKKFG